MLLGLGYILIYIGYNYSYFNNIYSLHFTIRFIHLKSKITIDSHFTIPIASLFDNLVISKLYLFIASHFLTMLFLIIMNTKTILSLRSHFFLCLATSKAKLSNY